MLDEEVVEALVGEVDAQLREGVAAGEIFKAEDIEYALPDETGFRGFIVEFYNIISGIHLCVCMFACANPHPTPLQTW